MQSFWSIFSIEKKVTKFCISRKTFRKKLVNNNLIYPNKNLEIASKRTISPSFVPIATTSLIAHELFAFIFLNITKRRLRIITLLLLTQFHLFPFYIWTIIVLMKDQIVKMKMKFVSCNVVIVSFTIVKYF